jgi:hypothetical protein
MSESQKKLYKDGYLHPRAKPIFQYSLENNFIKEWGSCYHAAREYKCSEMSIRNNVNNKTKQFKNFIWKKNKD